MLLSTRSLQSQVQRCHRLTRCRHPRRHRQCCAVSPLFHPHRVFPYIWVLMHSPEQRLLSGSMHAANLFRQPSSVGCARALVRVLWQASKHLRR
jgi:hypothetical protein